MIRGEAEALKGKDTKRPLVMTWNSGGKHVRRSCSCRQIDFRQVTNYEVWPQTITCGNDRFKQTDVDISVLLPPPGNVISD